MVWGIITLIDSFFSRHGWSESERVLTARIELAASKSVYSLYKLATLNSMLPEVVGRPSARWQPFHLRHAFIPGYVTFDLGMITVSQPNKSNFNTQRREIFGTTISDWIFAHFIEVPVTEYSTERS